MRNFRLSRAGASTANALTHVMILHPVACGLNFIAFLLAVGASVVGSFLASMTALLAFLVRTRPLLHIISTVIANARSCRSPSWFSSPTSLASPSSAMPSTAPTPAPTPRTGPLRGRCWPRPSSRSLAPSSSSSPAARPGSTVAVRPAPRRSTMTAPPAPVAAGSKRLASYSVALCTPCSLPAKLGLNDITIYGTSSNERRWGKRALEKRMNSIGSF